jgi:hypothetical protein
MRVFVLCCLAFFSVAVAAQSAPPLNEKLLKEAMSSSLKDAESARFKSIRYVPSNTAGMWKMCGEVNAKNSYGGYAGFSRFYGLVSQKAKEPPYYIVIAMGETADSMCKKMGS